MSKRVGFEGKLSIKAGGIAGGGGWLELDLTRDATVTYEDDEVDMNSRASRQKKIRPGMSDFTCEGEALFDSGDAAYEALRDAHFNKTVLGLKALDAAGGEGPYGDVYVTKWERGEPLDGAMTVSFTMRPADTDNDVTWSENP